MTGRGPVSDWGGGVGWDLVSKNIRKNDKTFPNHSPVVQHQTAFLICQQSVAQSQWTRTRDCTPSSISTHTAQSRNIQYVCTVNAEREEAHSAQSCLSAVNELHTGWEIRK